MKVVYLMLKCWIELQDLDKAQEMIKKYIEEHYDDIQLRMAYIKVLRLKGDDQQTLFEMQVQMINLYIRNQQLEKEADFFIRFLDDVGKESLDENYQEVIDLIKSFVQIVQDQKEIDKLTVVLEKRFKQELIDGYDLIEI